MTEHSCVYHDSHCDVQPCPCRVSGWG